MAALLGQDWRIAGQGVVTFWLPGVGEGPVPVVADRESRHVWQVSAGSAIHSELTFKLVELEKKHEEQTTQLRLLMASVTRLFEPQAEPKRYRTIGFTPPPQPASLEKEA